VPVPEGLFRSGRAGKCRGRDGDSSRASGSHGSSSAADSSGVQNPSSFSAFYSTPPDAAIRKFQQCCYITQPHYCPLIEYLYPTPGSYLPSTSQIMSTKAATGGRQHPSQPPVAVSSSHTREQYREQSTFRFPSSNSPSPSDHSRSDSGSRSSSPSPALLASQLVPLEYLQNISSPRRDPVDEQLLRKISTHSVSSIIVPQYGQSSKPPMRAQPVASPSAQSAARHAKSRYEAGWEANVKR
jgi:hypothetical protein